MNPQLVHNDITARRVQIPMRFTSDLIPGQAITDPSVIVNSSKVSSVKNYFKRKLFKTNSNVDFKTHNIELEGICNAVYIEDHDSLPLNNRWSVLDDNSNTASVDEPMEIEPTKIINSDENITQINKEQNNKRAHATTSETNESEENDDTFYWHTLPKRKTVNKIVKNMRSIAAHERLTNFLKIKYFMKRRDISTMNNMVADARTWLLKNKYSCERAEDYDILTTSVSLAYMVTMEELQFRQLMKNKQNYENMAHINATLDGDLGKTMGAASYKGESFGRSMLRSLPFPKTNIVI